MSRLKVADTKGKTLWRGQRLYGSDNSFLAVFGDRNAGGWEGDEMAYVNVRLIPRGHEIFLIRNISAIGDIFKSRKLFSGAEVEGLVWNGAMFMERWKSPEIPGTVTDIQIGDLSGDRSPELVVAVKLSTESFFSGAGGSAIMISRMRDSS
jgi:hypothetical protein